MRISFLIAIIGLLFGITSLTSCKKNQKFSTSNLTFSVDTLVFDTVFTTIGSTTQQFKLYNKDSKSLIVEEVELVGGENSPFRMNLDGLSGTKFSDLTLEKNDSLFCFVEVTLSVNNGVLPLIIEDSIRFRTNGVDQYVRLAVWGQDAYFHYRDLNEGTWKNDKPHVIYGVAAVDSAKQLIIPADTKIHIHKKSYLFVYKSTLKMEGTLGHEILVQGDRLEQAYKDVSGQYYGIYFHEAFPSKMNYVKIKNGTAGIHLTSRNETVNQATLTMTNCEIWNNASYGIFLYDGPILEASNVLVHSNGVHALLVLQGAVFNFNHSNLLSYGAGDGTNAAVGIRNYFTQNGKTFVGHIVNSGFTNSVIYGNGDQEVAFDTIQPGGATIQVKFNYCSIKKPSVTHPFFSNCLFEKDPFFIDPFKDDFKFGSSSSLSNAGISTILTTDILGKARNNPPDIGVYEL